MVLLTTKLPVQKQGECTHNHILAVRVASRQVPQFLSLTRRFPLWPPMWKSWGFSWKEVSVCTWEHYPALEQY